MTTVQIPLDSQYGYVIALGVLFFVQQQLLFTIPVGHVRRKYKIKPPTLYPSDSLIKELQLKKEDVQKYNSVQRVHQQNVEFLVTFLPLFFVAGLYDPMYTCYAGLVVFIGRSISAIGYYHNPNARLFGGFYHFGEFYVAYLCGRFAYSLLNNNA